MRFSGNGTDVSLGRMLGRALVATLDQNFIDPNLGGSVTNGATTISSSGNSLAQIDADLRALLAVFEGTDASLDSAVFIMAPRTAAFLASVRGTGGALAFPNISLRTGGNIVGVPLTISSGLRATGSPNETEIILMDPNLIAFADDGQFEISVSKSASVQLDDAPSAGATTETSLFQANLVALRAERWCGWARAGTTAVAVLDDVTY